MRRSRGWALTQPLSEWAGLLCRSGLPGLFFLQVAQWDFFKVYNAVIYLTQAHAVEMIVTMNYTLTSWLHGVCGGNM